MTELRSPFRHPTRTDGLLRPLVVAFVAAVCLYAVLYPAIEHRRTRNGPWQVAFTTTNDLTVLVINQPALAIRNVRITFPGAQPPPGLPTNQLAFAEPRQVPYAVPFGSCLFMDTTFLPGTLVFRLFGHEIQLLPRALTIDGSERPWRSEETIQLPGQ